MPFHKTKKHDLQCAHLNARSRFLPFAEGYCSFSLVGITGSLSQQDIVLLFPGDLIKWRSPIFGCPPFCGFEGKPKRKPIGSKGFGSLPSSDPEIQGDHLRTMHTLAKMNKPKPKALVSGRSALAARKKREKNATTKLRVAGWSAAPRHRGIAVSRARARAPPRVGRPARRSGRPPAGIADSSHCLPGRKSAAFRPEEAKSPEAGGVFQGAKGRNPF